MSSEKKELHFKRIYLNSDIYIKIVDLQDPNTWQVVESNEKQQSFVSVYKVLFQKTIQNADNVCFDIDHDDLGKRKYVSCTELMEYFSLHQPLKTIMEDEVKQKGYKILVAKYIYSEGFAQYNDYTIIEAYSQGNNQMILSNASALMDPTNKNLDIFKNVSLIVNCQTKDKVKYGIKSKNQIFYAVHEFGQNPQNINKILDQINEQIWKASRDGSVVIHCLAGMHRAPCILVSQVLYRYYKKGQKHLDVEFDSVYKSLSSIRGGVAPLSYIGLLTNYKKYLSTLM